MNLLEIIATSIDRLPEGDHSIGLKAVQRHIEAAIRHFERDNSHSTDGYTDAIYRTNQAFEGGLKEAYRVLTGNDPNRLSPYIIENYLEDNKAIRPRALKQLTRYREDYRNPPTHDYKLDFDVDEALLAIVSVTAFTKLLANQISAKLSFDAGRKVTSFHKNDIHSLDMLIDQIAVIAADAVKQLNTTPMDSDEIASFISGALNANGLDSSSDEFESEEDRWNSERWDIVTTHRQFIVPVEVRTIPTCDMKISLDFIVNKLKTEKLAVLY